MSVKETHLREGRAAEEIVEVAEEKMQHFHELR